MVREGPTVAGEERLTSFGFPRSGGPFTGGAESFCIGGKPFSTGRQPSRTAGRRTLSGWQRPRRELIKASPGCNAAVGALLHTEPTGPPVNVQSTPGLIRSIHLDPQGRPAAAFSKLGGSVDGINVYL